MCTAMPTPSSPAAPPSTNAALSCRSLDLACSLLRSAGSRLLGPRLPVSGFKLGSPGFNFSPKVSHPPTYPPWYSRPRIMGPAAFHVPIANSVHGPQFLAPGSSCTPPRRSLT